MNDLEDVEQTELLGIRIRLEGLDENEDEFYLYLVQVHLVPHINIKLLEGQFLQRPT